MLAPKSSRSYTQRLERLLFSSPSPSESDSLRSDSSVTQGELSGFDRSTFFSPVSTVFRRVSSSNCRRMLVEGWIFDPRRLANEYRRSLSDDNDLKFHPGSPNDSGAQCVCVCVCVCVEPKLGTRLHNSTSTHRRIHSPSFPIPFDASRAPFCHRYVRGPLSPFSVCQRTVSFARRRVIDITAGRRQKSGNSSLATFRASTTHNRASAAKRY